MKNHEVYAKNPLQFDLVNNGVSKVTEISNDSSQINTLRFEIENFVCDGEYARGLERIINAYLTGLNKAEQQAVWVSGFFGSGKSHLVKMLRYLWSDFKFPDGATARSLAKLPDPIKDLLVELSNRARPFGGLKAAAGTLGSGSMDNVRLAFLQLVFRANGLPENLAGARFVLWLKQHQMMEKVTKHLKAHKHDPEKEIRNFQVSTRLAEALVAADPHFGTTKNALEAIRAQFPAASQAPTIEETMSIIKNVFGDGKDIPCTLLVVDEVQQYVGSNVQRAMDVQQIAESCCSDLDKKLLLVCTGQSALTSTASLGRLQARFTVKVSLSDTDVQNVIRQTILAKKQEKIKDVKEVIDSNIGEISRHLQNTRLASTSADDEWYAADYPLLPVRRRFWEKVLRNVDESGTTAQLRTQLKIVFEAARHTAKENLGYVVAGDYIYDQIASDLLNTGVLPREYHETIVALRDENGKGPLKSRLCVLMFLIYQLRRRSGGADDGVRATKEMLADLLICNLRDDGAGLRAEIPGLLEELVAQGKVMPVDNEYLLQTREGAIWNRDFKNRQISILNNESRLSPKREEILREALEKSLHSITLNQGESKAPRDIEVEFTSSRPPQPVNKIVFWVRHGWIEKEKTIADDARAAGSESPMLFGFLPRVAHDEFKEHIASMLAAQETIDVHGTPTEEEGIQACNAIKTHLQAAEIGIQNCLRKVLADAKVFIGGGTQTNGLELVDMVTNAAADAMHRLFPRFSDADFSTWDQVLAQARGGRIGALSAVHYNGETVRHPVCKVIYEFIGSGKKGREIRECFRSAPFGWPQDAIDASLLILTLAGNLRATVNGQPITAQSLNVPQIGNTAFSVDIPPLTVNQRLELKALFQKLGISTSAGQESASAITFITALLELAAKAGGEPPKLEPPDTKGIRDFQLLSGNAQLLAIHQKKDDLAALIDKYKKASDLASQRLPRWNRLQEMCNMAGEIPEISEVKTSLKAIFNARSLLNDPDPLPPLMQKVGGVLRGALNKAWQEHSSAFDSELKRLESTSAWKSLKEKQRLPLIEKFGLHALQPLQVATEDDIYRELQSLSIPGRRTTIEALPQRFAQAADEAARILAPKAIRISLPAATVSTEKELEEWIAEVRDLAKEQLKQGPVIL